jgi:hypothetical protein
MRVSVKFYNIAKIFNFEINTFVFSVHLPEGVDRDIPKYIPENHEEN